MNGQNSSLNKRITNSAEKLVGRKFVKIIFDAFLLAMAYLTAYNVRFDFSLPPEHVAFLESTLPLAILINIAFINILRMNQSQWRYSSVQDLLNLFGAATAGWVGFIIYLYFANIVAIPRSVLFIFWTLSIIFLGGARFLPRIILKVMTWTAADKKHVLVIGAGDAGEMIIRQMKNDPELGYYPVALLDDNPRKLNTKIHGVKVKGAVADLDRIISKNYIDEIIISTPSAPPKEMRRIVEACEKTGIEFQTVPGPREIVNGHVKIQQIRRVKVEDLLDRSPIEIDLEQITNYLKHKTVLITGAGGSIGSELSRQVIKLHPEKLVCLDRTENSLFFLDYELQQLEQSTKYDIVIADILDSDKIKTVLAETKPDIVFHAAAYKHVPLMESHPEEAVRNNILGTLNMMKLAEEANVEKFVLISTDKAVNPSSVMGATKRVAELILQSYSAQAKIKLLTVRFGNVLGSFGSVVPLFQKQISQGGPVTITDPGMERFFMTIPEAVKLILQSAKMSNGNDIYVLDMGEPIKLINIAHRIIKLSGYQPEVDIPIKIIGRRPGEKLYEELWNKAEIPLKTDHPRISMAVGSHYNHWDLMMHNVGVLKEFARQKNTAGIYKKLQEIIPEYVPEGNETKEIPLPETTVTIPIAADTQIS